MFSFFLAAYKMNKGTYIEYLMTKGKELEELTIDEIGFIMSDIYKFDKKTVQLFQGIKIIFFFFKKFFYFLIYCSTRGKLCMKFCIEKNNIFTLIVTNITSLELILRRNLKKKLKPELNRSHH